jgi:crotonobetainyl-CoA:carnitine CoA-transferase CaiB-like acyl-CoA transferase
VTSSGIILEYDHHTAGRLRQTRAPGQFERTPNELRMGAPSLNEHGDEILREIGYSDAEIERLRHDGALGHKPELANATAA